MQRQSPFQLSRPLVTVLGMLLLVVFGLAATGGLEPAKVPDREAATRNQPVPLDLPLEAAAPDDPSSQEWAETGEAHGLNLTQTLAAGLASTLLAALRPTDTLTADRAADSSDTRAADPSGLLALDDAASASKESRAEAMFTPAAGGAEQSLLSDLETLPLDDLLRTLDLRSTNDLTPELVRTLRATDPALLRQVARQIWDDVPASKLDTAFPADVVAAFPADLRAEFQRREAQAKAAGPAPVVKSDSPSLSVTAESAPGAQAFVGPPSVLAGLAPALRSVVPSSPITTGSAPALKSGSNSSSAIAGSVPATRSGPPTSSTTLRPAPVLKPNAASPLGIAASAPDKKAAPTTASASAPDKRADSTSKVTMAPATVMKSPSSSSSPLQKSDSTSSASASVAPAPSGVTDGIALPAPLKFEQSRPGGRRIVRVVTVGQEDTLAGLAARFGTTIDAIRLENGLTSNALTPGATLQVPLPDPSAQLPTAWQVLGVQHADEILPDVLRRAMETAPVAVAELSPEQLLMLPEPTIRVLPLALIVRQPDHVRVALAAKLFRSDGLADPGGR